MSQRLLPGAACFSHFQGAGWSETLEDRAETGFRAPSRCALFFSAKKIDPLACALCSPSWLLQEVPLKIPGALDLGQIF